MENDEPMNDEERTKKKNITETYNETVMYLNCRDA